MRPGPLLCVLLLFSAIAIAQQPPLSSLPGLPAIQIVEGDGAINSIRLHRAHEPIVRVVGPDGEPVEGAAVTFLLPATGPSGTFVESGLSLTVPTDCRGIAVGRGLRPNAVPGQFRIRVNTSWRGSPAAGSLVQTNAEPVVHSGHTKKIAIIAVIAAAAVGGAAAAAGGKSSANNQSGTTGGSTTSGVIISGTPTIGPPR